MARKQNGVNEFERSLLRGMTEAVAVARGKQKPTRVYTVGDLRTSGHTVARPPAYGKDRILAIRKRLGVSQPIFAEVLNVSTPTVRGWEQGVREPEGPSLRVLEFAERQPLVLLEIAGLQHPTAATAKKRTDGRTGARLPFQRVRHK